MENLRKYDRLRMTLSPGVQEELEDMFIARDPDGGMCIMACVEALMCVAIRLLGMPHM